MLIVFAEGETGHDFFPDSALSDPLGASSAALPTTLPPDGADFSLFALYFDNATNDAQYSITGQLSLVPVPPALWLFASALGLLGWRRRKAL